MSFNRENVIWQSPDGTWNRGFYDFYSTGESDDPDYDSEWGVDYTDQFVRVRTGFRSQAAAEAYQPWGNPGGHTEVPATPENAAVIERLDDEAAKTYDAATRERPYAYGYHGTPEYSGPPKERKLKFLLADARRAKLEYARHRIQGYINSPDPKIPLWEARISKIIQQGRPADLEMLASSGNKYADGLEKLLQEDEERQARRRRQRMSSGWPKRVSSEHLAIVAEIKEEARAARAIVSHKKSTASEKASAGGQTSSPKGSAGMYHINPETGRPNKCYATKKACPFGGAASHFPTKEAARKGYEKAQGSSF